MLIKERDINDVAKCLEETLLMNMVWLAFDENRRSMVPKGMYFFHFKTEGVAFCKEKQRYFTDYKIVPVPRLLNIVKAIRELQRHDELLPFNIQINSEALTISQKKLLSDKQGEVNQNSITMSKGQLLSDEILSQAKVSFSSGENWIAYNTLSYFPEKGDIYFFKNHEEAREFAENNISEYDNYKIIHARSIDELMKKFSYGEKFENNYPIPRNILEEYPIADLMTKMAKADWYYDYSEDPDVWERGNKEINGIKADLLQLSKIENGVLAGNYLWDAYVPVYSVNRPDFLVKELKNDLSTFKNKIMNQDNLNYLKNNLKFSGFGETLNAELEKNISNGVPEFTLNHSVESNNRKMEANLHFKRGDQNEMYFFNKYDAKLTKADGTEIEQTFYMDKGRGVTFKEAVNLLEGRAVNKDLVNSHGQEYNAWIKLDFENKNDSGNYERKTYHENFGYNLEKALESHSIRELNDPTLKEKLIASLMKGNLQAASDLNGERIFIAAEPESGKSNKVALYDKSLKEITVFVKNAGQSQDGKEDLKNGKQQESKQPVADKNDAANEKASEQKKESKRQESTDPDELLPQNGKKKATGKTKAKAEVGDNDLIPKKRTSQRKGQSL